LLYHVDHVLNFFLSVHGLILTKYVWKYFPIRQYNFCCWLWRDGLNNALSKIRLGPVNLLFSPFWTIRFSSWGSIGSFRLDCHSLHSDFCWSLKCGVFLSFAWSNSFWFFIKVISKLKHWLYGGLFSSLNHFSFKRSWARNSIHQCFWICFHKHHDFWPF